MNSTTGKILYITGTMRSGTTMVDSAVGQMEGFTSLGEMRMIWQAGIAHHKLCGCGKPFEECPFWTAVSQLAFNRLDKADLQELEQYYPITKTRFAPLLLLPWASPYEKQYALYVEKLTKLYNAIREVSQANILIDSSKNPTYGLLLNRLPNWKVYILHLVRDSRGVAFSRKRKKQSKEIEGQTSYMPRQLSAVAAAQWSYHNLASELVRSKIPRYLRLQYEAFVANPKQCLAQICDFIEEPIPDFSFITAEGIEMKENHIQAGNPNRINNTGILRLSLDNEWYTAMPSLSKSMVTFLTSPLLYHYGYPLITNQA